jgi:DNA-binding response OmpR family regulator
VSGAVAESERPEGFRARAERLVVLVVEQRDEELRGLHEIVSGQPITLATCSDAAEALLLLGRISPDVVLLGPVCGRLDAVDFIRVARSDDAELPIIAGADPKTSEFAAVATAAGATAVIPRPYRAAELLAFLRSLARTENLPLRPPPIDVGRLRVDGSIPQIWIDGRQVTLPPMEYVLLRYFAERVGLVLSRAELIDAVWGDSQQASSNTLTVHIMRLRKRLGGGDGDTSEWIRSVRGLGYQLTVPPADADVPQQR